MRLPTNLLLIDNYDSFTYNLQHYFLQLAVDVTVVRNDAVSLADIEAMQPDAIVCSPGPCAPDQAGICLDVIRCFAGKIPLLGVCLGHQCIAQAFGGRIVRAAKVMHGKTSTILHTEEDLFADLPQNLVVTRYHSLVVEPRSLPAEFKVMLGREMKSWG